MKDSWNTVDFDESPGCMADRVMRDDMQRPHLPHHDLIKLRRVLHIREFGKTFRNAKEALERARAVFKAAGPGIQEVDAESDSSSDTEDETGHGTSPISKRLSVAGASSVAKLAIRIPNTPAPGPASARSALPPLSAVSVARSQSVATKGPRCANCRKPCVMSFCWFCAQCSEETFICWDCDAKGESGISALLENADRSHDFYAHDLVRVQEAVEEKDLTLEERIGEMQEVFRAHENKMEERMGRMEKLLERLVESSGRQIAAQ
ncbi:hypothetical protein C8F01DRAFT_1372414 [Mycena amicta]|nr:hypothetical protein C8F01DRAFT_1372414 [Mycena amicta]